MEACYCIAGEGEVEDMQGTVFPIRLGMSMCLISMIGISCAQARDRT
ncbi:hypothetical protein VRB50_08385 [Pseudomonas poae]